MSVQEDVFQEVSPLTSQDSFALFERTKKSFTFPVHIHEEYELNFVENAENAIRTVGNSVETIKGKDLILICNPSLKHAWQDGECQSDAIHEITIQFSPSLFTSSLFQKRQFASIMDMIGKASRGMAFSESTIDKVLPFLRTLTIEKDGFYSVMKFFMLLYELSMDADSRLLASDTIDKGHLKVAKLQKYIQENLSSQITLEDAAQHMGMSTATFSRFMKKNCNLNFSAYLLEYRMDAVLRKLNQIEEEKISIEELAEYCGFMSPSYFYKVFKKKTGMTPVEYIKNRKKNLIRCI